MEIKKEYEIHDYNLDNIKNGIVAVIGMRVSGKSTLVKDILIHKRAYKLGRIFNRQIDNYNYYSNYCDSYYITSRYNSYLLLEILEEQKQNNKQTKIIVFDDVLSPKGDWMKDKNMVELLEKAKELNILAIFCFQFSIGYPQFYNSIDYIFMLSVDFPLTRKRLYDHYAKNIILEFNKFEKIISRIFKDDSYNSFVIDKTLENKIYKYNASNVEFDFYKLKRPYPCEVYISDESSQSSNVSSKSNSIILVKKKISIDSDSSDDSSIKSLKKSVSSIIEPIKSNIKINLRNDTITIFKDDRKIEIEL